MCGFGLHEQHTREHGRMGPKDLDRLCPDWRERETFLSGPAEMIDAMEEQTPDAVVALSAEHDVEFLPPPS